MQSPVLMFSRFRERAKSLIDNGLGGSAGKLFPSGLRLLYEGDNPVIDIVFVHGLTGDRERTWKALNAADPWPKTLLPTRIANARILTFGYDAYVSHWQGVVSQNRIGNHSMNLLTAVATYRENDDTYDRPVIFIAHSLGGLVCEDALVTSLQRPDKHLQNIYQRTLGIIFLGTPLHGSGLATWAEMLAKSIGILKQTNPKILEVLRNDSEVLARIQDSFHTMVRTRSRDGMQPIEITCFYEELPLPGIGTVVPSHSAVLPGYTPIGIHRNHIDMTKFESTDDPGFIAIAGELCRWIRQFNQSEMAEERRVQEQGMQGIAPFSGSTPNTIKNRGNVANRAWRRTSDGGIHINRNKPNLFKILPAAHEAAFNSEDKTHDDDWINSTRVDVLDLLRYRYHHGTNIGTIYVLERWLSPSMFPSNSSSKQGSELQAVKLSVEGLGIDATREKWEAHWRTAVNNRDWEWLVNEAHCTTIRLPIGYFSLDPRFCKGTPFEPYSAVYANCWSTICNLIAQARQNGIGILLDFHALPGGANNEEHSGTNHKHADLWRYASHQSRAIECLEFIAREVVRGCDGVVGIQVCNEAILDAPGLYEFYNKALETIGAIDPTIPIYISDAWDLNQALDYALSKNSKQTYSNPIVVDTHIYCCFTDADKAKPLQQIIQEVPGKLSELGNKTGSVLDRGAADVIVGEYCCALDSITLGKVGSADREELVKQFGQAQSWKYQHSSAGSFFWTYKMDWLPGGEWGFIDQTSKGAIRPPAYLAYPPDEVSSAISHARSQHDSLKFSACSSHRQYWKQRPGIYEHWRYEHGWKLGWMDAERFFEGTDGIRGKIGALEIWVLKRVREGGLGRENCAWEWEHGFRKGVEDFERCVGIRW